MFFTMLDRKIEKLLNENIWTKLFAHVLRLLLGFFQIFMKKNVGIGVKI